MSEQAHPRPESGSEKAPPAKASPGGIVRTMELDLRLLGMIGALLFIWVLLDLLTDGRFITPRNLFNLSVQTASVAVMATGMVFVIVTRHIDLSVGAVLGVIAMVMGVVQAEILPEMLGFNHPANWILTICVGLALGLLIGSLQGWVIGYLGVPAFIVTLGGLLVWRGAAWWVTTGRTVAPLDSTFVLFGGGIAGTLGYTASWLFGILMMALAVFGILNGRRRRKLFDFPLKPLWADWLNIGVLCVAVASFVSAMNAYPVPTRAAKRLAEAKGWEIPEGGLELVHGIAIPVVIVAFVAIVMTIVARRTKFGRYVFAIGGNPQAAELSGIDTRRMTLYIFTLMGALCALSAVIASARLQSAANDLGTLDELRVIAAAVIGGTSLAGGVGTIYGAILGALVMQSLQSGMALIGINTSLQSIVIGLVLILAVWVDQLYRRRIGE
ncbi:sugar ABC transporter permease [Nisaea acidiphila]|uniref:Xylose transport system permease protein XylH n=1 Tax=Nisaea acidiphila TaxID=1862145 RepID=A0A9J7AQQ4_9PROT|nr:sugar ABC transporter permease [Nisaea acidiphila]UUX49939.1 sugar ABC transporter permease [Nisaea acidiphila]